MTFWQRAELVLTGVLLVVVFLLALVAAGILVREFIIVDGECSVTTVVEPEFRVSHYRVCR